MGTGDWLKNSLFNLGGRGFPRGRGRAKSREAAIAAPSRSALSRWSSGNSCRCSNRDPGLTKTTTGGGLGTWSSTSQNWYNPSSGLDQALASTDTGNFGGSTGGLVTVFRNGKRHGAQLQHDWLHPFLRRHAIDALAQRDHRHRRQRFFRHHCFDDHEHNPQLCHGRQRLVDAERHE